MNSISRILRIPEYQVSTGSTEPRDFLLAVASQLGMESSASQLDKPGIGKLVVESAGEIWLPEFESRGSTVTKFGLLAIERAVLFYLRLGA